QRRGCLSPSAGGRRPPDAGHPVGRIQPARRARAVLALRDCAGPRPPPCCRLCRQSQCLPHGEITRSTVEHPTQCRTFAASMGPRSVAALDWPRSIQVCEPALRQAASQYLLAGDPSPAPLLQLLCGLGACWSVEGLAEGEELASNILPLPCAGMATTMSRPIVVTACMSSSSESWEP